MGLLSVLNKEARWTKHLPEKQRAKADYITALRGYEKLKDPRNASGLLQREVRLNELAERSGVGDYLPRVGGKPARKGDRFSTIEKMLGADDPALKKFQRPSATFEQKSTATGKTKIPGPPPRGEPRAYKRLLAKLKKSYKGFSGGAASRAKEVGSFASKHRKPLMAAGAGAAAAGLGILGVHAATQKRHDKLRGKG